MHLPPAPHPPRLLHSFHLRRLSLPFRLFHPFHPFRNRLFHLFRRRQSPRFRCPTERRSRHPEVRLCLPPAPRPPRPFPRCHPQQSLPFRRSSHPRFRPSPGQRADWRRQEMGRQSRHPQTRLSPAPHPVRRFPPPHPSASRWFHLSFRLAPAIHPTRPSVLLSFRLSLVIHWPHPSPHLSFHPSPAIRPPHPWSALQPFRPSLPLPSSCHSSRHLLPNRRSQHPVQPRPLHRCRPLPRPRLRPCRQHHSPAPRAAA